jgi:hypothetical protein
MHSKNQLSGWFFYGLRLPARMAGSHVISRSLLPYRVRHPSISQHIHQTKGDQDQYRFLADLFSAASPPARSDQ